jgi:hypothetical protein
MFSETLNTPVQGNWVNIDPMIFAQIQQIAQMSAVGAQTMLQQQGQQQVVQQNQVEQQQGM